MAILEVKLFGCPVLRKRCAPVGRATEEARTLTADMFETMYASDGIGLAGPQVGVICRLIVVDVSMQDPSFGRLALLDPVVVEADGEEAGTEGCLSIPEVTGEVVRPARVRVRGMSPDGEAVDMEATGIAARVLQHEIDHLDGVLFTDRMNPVRRQLLRAALRKIRKRGQKQRHEKRIAEASAGEGTERKASSGGGF